NYSIEEDTPAYLLNDPVPQEEKEERKSRIMEIQKEISLEKNQNLKGHQLKVLIDSIEDDYFIGRSEKDAPEVDGEILIEAKSNRREVANYYDIEIMDCNEYDLFEKLIR